MRIKTYTAMSRIATFEERYQYLKLSGIVGAPLFGYARIINQALYTSRRWSRARDFVIDRDNGCDLGMDGYEIQSGLLVHHMNPLSIEEVELDCDYIYDPEFLITTVLRTHNAIHYGSADQIAQAPTERRQNDTCPWR